MTVDQLSDTFDDPELEQAFRVLETESHTLDPTTVMTGGRRRRRRRRVLATSGAALATAAVSAMALVAASLDDPGEPPVAQQPAAATTPALRTIPDGEWVKMSRTQWFRFRDGVGTSSDRPKDPMTDDVTKVPEPRRTQLLEFQRREKAAREQARQRGWDGPMLSSKGARAWHEIYVRGDVRRVVLTVTGDYGRFQYEAGLFRLAGLPGWVYAYAEFPSPSPVVADLAIEKIDVKVDAYGADGQRILRCGYNPRPTTKADAGNALPPCDQG
jgi:hypothetical protein